MMSWMLGAAHAACPEPTSLAQLSAALDAGDAAVGSLDRQGLSVAVADADERVRCLSTVAPAGHVARYFGLRGVLAFVDGQSAAAVQLLAVPRELGAWAPPASLAGPLTGSWAAAGEVPVRWVGPITPPPYGSFVVDGRPSDHLPAGRPYLLQHVEGDVVLEAWVMDADAPVPAIAPRAAPPRHRSLPLALGGVAALAAGGALGGVAAGWKGTYDDTRFTTTSEEQRQFRRVNAAGYPAYGLLAAGAGLGLGAVLVGEW